MRQGIVTIVTPVKPDCDTQLRELIEQRICADEFRVLSGLHFASLSVIDDRLDGPEDPPFNPHLVFEASFDGCREDFVDELVLLVGHRLNTIYVHCEGYPSSGVALPQVVKNYLIRHDLGADTLYVATPGRTVEQIRQESRLRDELHHRADCIRRTVPHEEIPPPTQRSIVNRLRREVAQVAELQGMLTPPERPFVVTYGAMLAEAALRTILALLFLGLLIQFRAFSVPSIAEWLGATADGSGRFMVGLLLMAALMTRLTGVLRPAWNRVAYLLTLGALAIAILPDMPAAVIDAIARAVMKTATLLFWPGVALLGIVVAWLALVQLHEFFDTPDPEMPSWKTAHEEPLRDTENRRAQNHMVGLNRIKGGLVRRVTVRIVLWTIHLTKHLQKSGLLSGVSSIHFARWVLIDKGRQVLFLSHYDGDWDAYLGDFVTQASRGLTAVWSNCIGFPRAWFLFFGGASDERTFKAYARKHQHKTLLVYSAYPTLTVNDIENHTAIREALGRPLDTVGVDDLLRRI